MESSNIDLITERALDLENKTAEQALQEVIIHNPMEHPERTDATMARVIEVIKLIAGNNPRAEEIISKCKKAVKGSYKSTQSLSSEDGTRVADILSGEFEDDEVQRAIGMFYESELSTDEVVSLHKQYKIPVSHLEDDLLPVKGDGAKIRDSLGREYVDLDSNYSATNLGNSNPEIARGLFNQANLLISQKEDRIQVARARFLKEIRGMMPGDLSCFYWQNSGGEAVDKALKIAKAYTGHTGVVAFEGGFHGRTHGAVAVTYNKKYREPFGLDKESWVHFAPFGNLNAVESLLAGGKAKTVILELVQGEEAGINPATQEFATGLRALCDRYGAVMIADEVQTGFGRVANGEGQWFASHLYDVVPDIITIGKSFGGGYPVTAVVTKPEISEKMQPGYDGSTFGGNPMAMVAALIATRQMKALNLPAVVEKRSKEFALILSGIDSPLMKGFRTVGLMIGIDLESAECVHKVQEAMKKHGAHSSLSTGATMRWMPPLVIESAEVKQVVKAFASALKEINQ